MGVKNITDVQQNTETLKGDLLLLVKILNGELEGEYQSYPYYKEMIDEKKIDKVIIYAEFDRVYHYEHIKFANDCYLRENPKTKKKEWLTKNEYFEYLKSLISSSDEKYSQNSRLKNKVDNTFSLLYHIIDGSNFEAMTYTESEKGKVSNWKITPEIKAKRDSVIKKTTKGKASTRRVVYEYKEPVTIYKEPMTYLINQHFKVKNDAILLNRIESVAKGDVDYKTEIIDALTNSRNKDNIAKIREIENELESHKIDSSSHEEIVSKKYNTAIKLALQLSDPDEIAILCIKYLNFISSRSETSIDDMLIPGHLTINSALVKQCLDSIIQHSPKSFEELQEASRKIGKEFGLRMKKGFESQITLLRKAQSAILPDILYTYAVFCMSMYDFKTAEDCLIECYDIYLKSKDPDSLPDLIIICSNLCKLYSDWRRVDDAVKYGELCIKYMKRCEVLAYNSLNMDYANLYNLVSVSYLLQHEFDKAIEYNRIASSYIEKEDDHNDKVFYLQLMIEYNYSGIKMYQEDYLGAYAGMELFYWKTMLLCAMNDSLEYLNLKGSYENALARCEMSLGRFEDAKSNVEEGIKTYNKLCEKSYQRFAVDRLYLLQTLADIYDAQDLNTEAEKQYLFAITEAKRLIDSGVYVVKGRLHEIITNLAGLYNKIGKYDLAIQQCLEVLDICDELSILDEDYYKVERIKGLDNLAIAYYNLENIMKAVECCHEALDICASLFESDYNKETIEYWTMKIQHDLNIMING